MRPGGIVALEAGPVRAEDLDAENLALGSSQPAVRLCHRSPHALAKRTNAWSLAYFLRQHYTASSQQASVLTGYLLSVNNAASREKQRAVAVGPQQSLLSWLGLSSDSGRKRPKTTKRVKAVSPQPAAAAAAPAVPAETLTDLGGRRTGLEESVPTELFAALWASALTGSLGRLHSLDQRSQPLRRNQSIAAFDQRGDLIPIKNYCCGSRETS